MAPPLRTATALAALFALGHPVAAPAATIASQPFTSPGEHQFVVPAGVTSVQVVLVGGNGGAGKGPSGGSGGIPATVTAQLATSPGEVLYAEVAGNGQAASGAENAGGYGAGGGGGESGFGGVGGGGGGGASDLRTCPASAAPSACGGLQSLGSRLIVAGGGGGGGGHGIKPESAAGGNGGPADQSGSAGQKNELSPGGSGGARGTLSAGGEAGGPNPECEHNGKGCATSGASGGGGAGGAGAFGGGGGGGGGGVYGGGGGGGGGFVELVPGNGAGGGGGGGASGVPAGAAGVSAFSLVPTATGAQPSIQVSWTMPPPAVSTGAPRAIASTTATLTGTINPDGSQISDCHFVVAPAPAGAATAPCTQQIGAGSAPVAVSAGLVGLQPSTAYTVTLVASSAQGTTSGAGVGFTTAAAGTSSGSLGVTQLTLSPARFHRGRRAATVSVARPAVGTTISFRLSAAATVTLSFDRAQSGVHVGRRCFPAGKSHAKGRRCTRYTRISHTVARRGHAGLNRVHFEGVLDGGTRLAPGGYRLSLSASGPAGTAGAAQHPAFTLLP